MAKRISTQNAFNSGEVSPRLYGRQDVSKEQSAVESMINFKVTPHGPAIRRTGTKYIEEVKTSSKETRLIKFQFSKDVSYIIEMGDLYFRFYKDGARLGAPYEISHPYTEAQLFDVTYAQFGNSIYFAHGSHAPRKLTRNGDTDWDLETINFRPEATKELGEFPSTTVTPGATTGSGIAFTAGASVFEEADVGRRIINETGTGIANVTAYVSATELTCTITEDFPSTSPIASGDWKLDLSPVADLNPTKTAAGQIAVVTAEDSADAAIDTFRSTDVGRYILMSDGVLQIVAFNSASNVDCEVLKSLSTSDETGIWTLEDPAWSATRGYPRAVGVFEQRLWYASTDTEPQTLWGSEVSIFDGFGVGPADADAIDVTISSAQVNQINWMVGTRDLVLGSSGAESTVSSGSSSALSPSSIKQQPRTYYGSSTQQPMAIGEEVIFIQNSQRKIRSFRYDFALDGYTGEDLTFLCEHITEDLVKIAAYAQEPDSIIYAVLESGDMLAGTYKRDQKVIGFSRYTTDGEYEDVQTISVGSVDQVWVIVNRTINGSTKRYIELLDNTDGTLLTDGFSDSFLVESDPKAISAITKADPGVVTTATHGFSNGDDIKLIGVGGMTEVEGITYRVANSTATTFELESTDPRTSIVKTTLQWTASGSGTDEYYLEASGGGDPRTVDSSIDNAISVYENAVVMTGGTVGSLATGEWDLADNDTLGFTTIYVRLADGSDPDDKGSAWLTYAMGVDTSSFTTYTSGGNAFKLFSTISGLTHLEAKEVQIKTDGGTHANKTVSSGSVTLDAPAYQATVGLPYISTMTQLREEFDVGLGSMQGRRSRAVEIVVRVYNSAIPTVNDNRLPGRSGADEMDMAVPLFSGDLKYPATNWGDKVQTTLTMEDPLPLHITAIYTLLDGTVK